MLSIVMGSVLYCKTFWRNDLVDAILIIRYPVFPCTGIKAGINPLSLILPDDHQQFPPGNNPQISMNHCRMFLTVPYHLHIKLMKGIICLVPGKESAVIRVSAAWQPYLIPMDKFPCYKGRCSLPNLLRLRNRYREPRAASAGTINLTLQGLRLHSAP